MDTPRLILGSTSPYRRELLSRLRLPFETHAPDVDETPQPGETPVALAMRLARAKAEAVAALYDDDAVVIGSDQVADLAGQAIGKPGDHARARAQLQAMQGNSLRFHTVVCVVRRRLGYCDTVCDTVTVRMRALTDAEIETYLRLDTPYDCAGSAKCESLGITLLDAIESTDPTSLIGLPLIATTRLMRAAGLDVLAALQHD